MAAPRIPFLNSAAEVLSRILDQTADAVHVIVDGGGAGIGTARTAADNLALPTAPDVLATLMGYDGSTLDLLRTHPASTSTPSSGLLGVVAVGLNFNQNAMVPIQNIVSDADGRSTTYPGVITQAQGSLFNGTNIDRQRSNIAGTLLASAARTTTNSTAAQVGYNHRGVRVFVNITAVPGVETLTVTIETVDPISSVATALLTSAALVATGHTVLEVYPGITPVANLAVAKNVGRGWRVTVTHSAGGSFTYSVGYESNL